MATRGAQQRAQKGRQVLDYTEEQARAHIERLMWPNGEPVCRHCGSVNAYRMKGKSCRPGLCRCRDCKKQFTVTVGTIFEDSHLPLSTWVKAIHMMATSKKGMSALQLMRNMGLGSYKTAWFMAHRIRYAMKCDPIIGMLKGTVQADETYVGADRHPKNISSDPKKYRKRGRGTDKAPVMVLVETDGNASALPIERVNIAMVKAAMERRVDSSAKIVTDESNVYPKAAAGFAGGHHTVRHAAGQYVAADGSNTNTAESFFSLLKRGITAPSATAHQSTFTATAMSSAFGGTVGRWKT